MDVAKKFSAWFWTDSFWLPGNATWKDLERSDEFFYPSIYDLKVVLPIAGLLYVLRCFFEKCVAVHIGRAYNISEQPAKRIVFNELLEYAFRTHGKILPSAHIIKSLAQDTKMSTREIERWWRRRTIINKPSKMQRFTETSWRFLYYILSFWTGLYILWDKPWLWDTKECWRGFPKQIVTTDMWFYYIFQLSFYVSLIFSLCKDIRRKDFGQMMVHHFATIYLMVFSWTINMVRAGSLILCLHDTVDYWLEGAKLANYLRYSKLCDLLFLIFALLWFITRLVIYPFRILNMSWFEIRATLGHFGSLYIFNMFLVMLFILHVIWFVTIVRMVFKFLVKGKVEKDGRSDTDDSASSSENEKRTERNTGGFVTAYPDQAMRVKKSIQNLQNEFMKNRNGHLPPPPMTT